MASVAATGFRRTSRTLSNTRVVPFLLVPLLAASACGDDGGSGSPDGGGGGRDAATDDAGDPPEQDAGQDAGGTSDAGATDAATDDAGAADAGDMDAGPPLPTAVAEITQAEGEGDIMGTVTFVQDGDDVTVTYEITNCPEGTHPTHIHEGSGCEDREQMGMHWDPPRGEEIPDIECDEAGTGTVTYTRTGDNADEAWTIGDGSETDIVGHPVVIHGAEPATDPRIGCGVIALDS